MRPDGTRLRAFCVLGPAMPALSNPRHERFAQELAKGSSASDAYVTAGYKASRAAASRMSSKVNIADRVSEIRERASIRAEISIASVTARLERIADKAEAMGDSAGLSVARAAMMDAAKLNGLVVEKSENVNKNYAITDEPMTDDEWQASHAAQH